MSTITGIELFHTDLPNKGGGYRRGTFSSGPAYQATIVRITIEDGLTGLGEVCPIGYHYGPGSGGAALDGAKYLAGMLIGENAVHIGRLNTMWDQAIREDQFSKTPFDMALWDLAGKRAGVPVSDLIGGTWDTPCPLYRSIYTYVGQDNTLETFVDNVRAKRAEGYRHFQLKSGGDIKTDIARIRAVCAILEDGEKAIFDANTAWSYPDAVLAAKELRDLPVILEQPCRTMEEMINFRRHWPGLMKLDEVITTPQDIIRAYNAGVADTICLKIGRVGGLSKARQMRDLAISLGLGVVADDIWGSEIVSAALSHFAQSTDPKFLLNTTDLTDYVEKTTASGFPYQQNGKLRASNAPGLGIELNEDAVGDPVAVYGA